MIVVGQDGTLKLGTADYNFNALDPLGSLHVLFTPCSINPVHFTTILLVHSKFYHMSARFRYILKLKAGYHIILASQVTKFSF